MEQEVKNISHIQIVIDSNSSDEVTHVEPWIFKSILTKFHAGYFRISLSLCSQALLWKFLSDQSENSHVFRRVFSFVPSTAFTLLWSIALFTLSALSLLYILRCLFCFKLVKKEFLHQVGVNYLFAPWISWLLLLQSSPFFTSQTLPYIIFCWILIIPIVILDLKIYGQWFTKGKKFLSTVANPTSQMSVIGNLIAARAAAEMGWIEVALCMFSLGMTHYLVLFVTLYQRLNGSNGVSIMLRPVFFLFFAAPSVASLAWAAISGGYDVTAKILFFLSLFLFLSLVIRPNLFKKSMKKFNVAWWAYCFPLTVLAMASAEYAEEVKGSVAYTMMLVLSVLSILISLILIVFTAINTNMILPGSEVVSDPRSNDTSST